MDYDYEEEQVPSGFVTGIKFDFVTDEDAEKMSVKEIKVPNDVIHPVLGIPTPLSSWCLTCGARDVTTCEGHFGVIKFSCTIMNPYFISDIAKILNRVCPGCKYEWSRAKSAGSSTAHKQREGCKYCDGHSKDKYPRPQFKVTSKGIHGFTTIQVKINERILKETESIACDYWGFIENDPQQQGDATRPSERILSHYQVYKLLKSIDQKFLKELVGDKKNLLFMNNFPVTPNSHRVNEFGQQIRFDERTMSYRKLADFKSSSNELCARVVDCLKMSKLRSKNVSAKVNTPRMFIGNENGAPKMSGLKFIKELILGKRTDHAVRMVVVGDPNIKVDEIGVPYRIAEAMLISEQLNARNWENMALEILTKGETYLRRGGRLVRVNLKNDTLQFGDTIYRPLRDGDIVLMNRPPSIHPHSLIALYVKILSIDSVLSLNPLICSPFRGDFDGDCYHGYIPQSVESRVELRELVALDKQLINTQSGQNLLTLNQDSLTGVQLITEDGVLLNRFQVQQLQMYCPQPRPLQLPAIIKTSSHSNCLTTISSRTCLWTGKQLFSLLLPLDFDYNCPSNSVQIVKGKVVSSQSASSWLDDTKGNLLSSLLSHRQGDFLDFLHAAQGLLCEWLSMRGLSVSLADMYLSPDCQSRKNMIDEVCYGLLEAEHVSYMKLLMVDSNTNFLFENPEESETARYFGVEHMFYDRQKSAALTQVCVSTFKHVFKDIKNLFYRYAGNDNAFLAMLKAGNKKSNLTRAVQHGMCLGLQHSLVPLSFRIPHQLSCAAWNRKSFESLDLADDQPMFSNSYIPYAVVQNSFLSGLNPLECFVHSLTTRDSSFGGHADISGTLNRKIMFFMRDLCIQYDGTVRSAYGNHVIQFSYNSNSDPVNSPDGTLKNDAFPMGGDPVGSLAACAISEAAYSALDQPISALEASPLLNLKEILECGGNKVNNAASLFLSKKLGRWTHGFEYAALEVKNHLERLLLLDIVSTVTIMYSRETGKQAHVSPWVCHFHISKEMAKRKEVKMKSIIDALYLKCNSTKLKSKANLPDLHITTKECSQKKMGTICIAIRIIGSSENSSAQLDTLEDTMIPFLLQTVIKGSSNVKKVDISWKDPLNVSTSHMGSSGELYLRVFMSETCDRSRFWAVLMDDCLKVMDMIDWERSYPEDIPAAASALGIDIAKTLFISKLASAISDTGKVVLPKHISLVADCLSSTGEFVVMSAKGLARQRKQTSISSPLTQACFSSPADCFVNAAKMGSVDNLRSSIDALAWGNSPSLGTGAQFDIVYSGKCYVSCSGSSNVKKVDISWKDPLNVSTSHMGSSGELYLRVFMSETCDRSRFWAVLMDDCLKVMDMIDWERSYPEDIPAAASALGIDIAKTLFISKLASAISDTGKVVLPKHISLVADCLSSTGEFVVMSAKGLARQRKQTSISSPLTQACFSSPADCFVNAAKMGSVDNLRSSIDALAWGNSPSLGTGAQFDIVYSGKGYEVEKPENVYNLLGSQVNADEHKVKTARDISVNSLAKQSEFLRKNLNATHLLLISQKLRNIIYMYGVDQKLIEFDEKIATFAFKFHPRYSEKIGCGLQEIKVVKSSKCSSSRCFQLVRPDGSKEDFSYHKCIHHALKLIAPESAQRYESKWLHRRN